MKKMVRYLYEYQNGKRVRNMGFVRVEEGERDAGLQIHGKGFPVGEQQLYELFLFYREGDRCIGISMGTIQNQSPMFAYRLQYDADDVYGAETFDRIEGLIISVQKGEKKCWYGAEWNESNTNIEEMIPFEQDQMKDHMEEQELEMEIVEEELPEMVEMERSEPERRDVIYKITRQDLVGLPRCEWKLANNHFLLHGYQNYHHLVSFEKEENCWLGVPGIFHPEEQKMAAAFGFEHFMRPDEGDVELTEEQKEEAEEFGYWCRKVSVVIKK